MVVDHMQHHPKPVPKPHDPRQASMTPEELSARFEAVLSQTMDDLATELAEYEACLLYTSDAADDLLTV